MRFSHNMNMCEGSILKKMIIFALPLMITNVLQIIFNATDVAVLGILVGDDAVAAVGANNSLINLITCVFIGLSIGANVLVARLAGEQNRERAKKAVGTSMCIGIAGGLLIAIIGVFFSRTFLEWTACDAEIIDMAEKYLVIYLLGAPIVLLYNFASAVLRAVGDTTRPMIYLIIGGVSNVFLNIFFIKVFGMDVDGVAIATVMSQLIASVLAVIALMKSDGYDRLELKYIRIYKEEFVYILKVGIPAGIKSGMFSFANVIIQSSINSLGKAVMSANTIAVQIEGITYQAIHAVSLAATSFTSQNNGAGNMARVKKVAWQSLGLSMLVGVGVGAIVTLIRYPLCDIMSNDAYIIDVAAQRVLICGITYCLCGTMDAMSGVLVGLGKSTSAMIISLLGSCVLRLVWVYTVFKLYPTYVVLISTFPISWAVTTAIYLCVVFPLMKKMEKESKKREAEPALSR